MSGQAEAGQAETGGTPRPSQGGLSLRRNFSWGLVGNVAYSLVLWLLVVMLARLGTTQMVGEFALAQAIAAPVFLTLGLNLRAVRSTDVRRVWSSSQYGRLRLGLNGLSVLITCGVALLFGSRGAALAVVLVVCAAKASEATSQVLYGYFQIRDRVDLVARSLLLRAALGSSFFIVALVSWRNLLMACVGLALGWFTVYLVHDRRMEKSLLRTEDTRAHGVSGATTWTLARKAAPLGLDAGVSSLGINSPRFAVQHYFGTSQLGFFVPLAYLAQVITLVTGSMAISVMGQMARAADRGDRKAYERILGRLVLFGAGVAITGFAFSWLFGEVLMRLLLGPDYVQQSVLLILMAGSVLVTVQRCLGLGLQAGHLYRGALAVDVITLAGTAVAALLLVPAWGLEGAAATLGIGTLAGSIWAVVLLRRLTRGFSAAGAQPAQVAQ